jgi:hypothetical protein
MFEERIPGGRYITTTALLLGLLAIIAGSFVFLLQHVALPIYTFLAAAASTGKITRSGLFGFLFSMVTATLTFVLLEWAVKGSRRLMTEVLDNSKDVLKMNEEALSIAGETNQQMREVVRTVETLEARIAVLENRD